MGFGGGGIIACQEAVKDARPDSAASGPSSRPTMAKIEPPRGAALRIHEEIAGMHVGVEHAPAPPSSAQARKASVMMSEASFTRSIPAASTASMSVRGYGVDPFGGQDTAAR